MKKALLGSQIQALQVFGQGVFQAKQRLQNIVNMVMKEQGIPEQERNLWKFSADGKFLERIEKPKMTIPKKQKKEEKKK